MPAIIISSRVLALVPSPKTRHALEAVRKAMERGMPAPTESISGGPYTTMRVPDDLFSKLDSGRGSVQRYIAAAVASEYGVGEVVKVEKASPPKQQATTDPRPTNAQQPAADPRLTKAQRRVEGEREARVKTAIEDANDGKWARIIFTSGHRSVDRYREDGDYFEEIESGLVFRTTVPMDLSADQARDWVAKKAGMDSTLSRMHWWYLDGDSETITIARDAMIRSQIVSEGGPQAEAVAAIEAEETLQVRLLGRKSSFLRLAADDVLLLGREAHPTVQNIALLEFKKNQQTP